MTTNTTNSQAASIDTPEFRELFHACESYLILHDDDDQYRADVTALVAHIDAKLAWANQRADIAEAIVKDKIETIALYRQELKGENSRAIAAESRLAEIQRGVEGLQGYDNTECWGMEPNANGGYLDYSQVLALIQPQPTSCTHDCNQGRNCTCR